MTDDWLRARYITDGMSANDIAQIVGRDPKSVWTWLRNAGVATRPRGHDDRQLFKKGCRSPFTGIAHTAETKRKLSAARKGKPVVYKGDGPHWTGKKGALHPSWKGGLTPERQAFYSSPEWKAACKAVWFRADAKCERCSFDSRSVPSKDRRFHVHHIISFQVRESRSDPENLVLLCAPCHRFVHSKKNTNNTFIVRI